MTPNITHAGLEISAKTADEAYQTAQKFNQDAFGGKMKAIIADEIGQNTYWVTLAETEILAKVKHQDYLEDNGWSKL